MAKRTAHCSLGEKLRREQAHHAARLSPRSIFVSFSTSCPNGWVPFTRVHLGQRAEEPAQGRSQNTQHQTRQKRRTTDAGPRTTAPRKTSIPTTTEQLQLLGSSHLGRLSRPYPLNKAASPANRSWRKPWILPLARITGDAARPRSSSGMSSHGATEGARLRFSFPPKAVVLSGRKGGAARTTASARTAPPIRPF